VPRWESKYLNRELQANRNVTPASFVRALFDEYAERFDDDLVGSLRCRGHEQACAPLAAGQEPLASLHSPSSGYTMLAALDWLGCGGELLPSTGALTVDVPWLVAISYTCPTGTAAASTGAALTVSEAGALPGSSPEVIAEGRTDSADLTGAGPAGSAIGPGSYRLSVTGPTTCLWHLAVYRS